MIRLPIMLSCISILSVLNKGAIAAYPPNPTCFQNPYGKPVALIGDYTWGTFSEEKYNFAGMFHTLKSNGLNLARIWVWCGEEKGLKNYVYMSPFLRTGPDLANDGLPKYDLNRFNPAFFVRLRRVCEAAQKRHIYLQLILFDAWMIKFASLWKMNACNRANNINGVNGDPNRTGLGTDSIRGFCSLGNPGVLAIQKSFIRKVINTVGSFNNVFFEIANENFYNRQWELSLARYIHQYEKNKPIHHLVMPLDLPDHSYDGIQTWDLKSLHANLLKARRLAQPLIYDTDGLGNPPDSTVRKAAWTAFISGGNFDFLDQSLEPGIDFHGNVQGTRRVRLRQQLGYLARFTKRVKFWKMQPSDNLIKDGNASAMASHQEILAYLPNGGTAKLDVAGLKDKPIARWYSPVSNEWLKAIPVKGSADRFTAPDDHDWLLELTR